jgi:hypothetical protein
MKNSKIKLLFAVLVMIMIGSGYEFYKTIPLNNFVTMLWGFLFIISIAFSTVLAIGFAVSPKKRKKEPYL